MHVQNECSTKLISVGRDYKLGVSTIVKDSGK